MITKGTKVRNQGLFKPLNGNSLRAATGAMSTASIDAFEVALVRPLLDQLVMHKVETTAYKLLCKREWKQARVKYVQMGSIKS